MPALKEGAGVFFAAALGLVVVYSIGFFDFHPEFVRFDHLGDVSSITISGEQFTPAQAGDGGCKDGAAVMTEYLQYNRRAHYCCLYDNKDTHIKLFICEFYRIIMWVAFTDRL